jgi:fructose-1,6-bisphosphatase I
MMASGKSGLAGWLENQSVTPGLKDAIGRTAAVCAQISALVRAAPLEGNDGSAKSTNVQGEEQKQLDVLTNDMMVGELSRCPEIAAMVSEEVPGLVFNEEAGENAALVACFDPLDGSSNIETNAAIGTIFSLLKLKKPTVRPEIPQVLAAAQNQVAAGYVLYGPSTLLVLSFGSSVAIFALEPGGKDFLLVEEKAVIPAQAAEFAINMAYANFWDKAVSTYVEDCIAGKTGPRGKAFNMRWTGSMVADVHRLFVRGGIFIYPSLAQAGRGEGKLRFLYEANPMAFLIEAAGGRALTGKGRIRAIIPGDLHQRAPVILGSSEEVDVLGALYEKLRK